MKLTLHKGMARYPVKDYPADFMGKWTDFMERAPWKHHRITIREAVSIM